MTAHPALETMLRNQMTAHEACRRADANALLFDTVDEFVEIVFGPQQYDAHLTPWRWHNFCISTYGFTPDYSRRKA